MAISSIIDFINELKKIPKLRDFELYFRGHSDYEFNLKPSVYRNRLLIENEHILYKEFILRAPSDFLNDRSTMEKLVKMQHYGLPTRLLDLTTNALVALYFACIKNVSKDGNVVVFRIPINDIKYFDSDTVSVISNIVKRPSTFSIENLRILDNSVFNQKSEITYLLHEIREEKSYFQSIINPNDLERVVAVKVKQNNSRIIKQSGAFLLFGINGHKINPASIPTEWILNYNLSDLDFRVPDESKSKILNELDTLGINESTLFPEMQNQAQYLKNYFIYP
jgi:hypothetical protein